jgi:hypothetical protein
MKSFIIEAVVLLSVLVGIFISETFLKAHSHWRHLLATVLALATLGDSTQIGQGILKGEVLLYR